ncbi:MAG: NAD-dependent epimerase/dehydratase family protein [Thermomicrobiales bacterium]
MDGSTEIFLTGGTGFVGAQVLRALLDAGYQVRALVHQHPERLPALAGCTPVCGDLAAPGALARAMVGCRYLVHVAALYSFAPRDRARIWETNVQGCRGLLEAARLAGIERAVVTSSSSAVGPAVAGRPATEADRVIHHDDLSAYHGAKIAEEQAALAAQLPVVLVLPTAPVGSGDWKPTPTGRIVLDFLRGRMVASVNGGMNVVAVEDVARAHVLALEQGRPGERYLIGGENLSFDELWRRLAAVSGRRAPGLHLPHRLVISHAGGDELRCRLLRATPVIPLEGARMARHYMYASSAKAERELGYQPSPVTEALVRAVAWYRNHGYAA